MMRIIILYLSIFLMMQLCAADNLDKRCGECAKKNCTDPNEEYILAKTGEITCNGLSPTPCNPIFECRCKKGFVRHEGKCIKPCDCPPICKDQYEEYILTSEGEETCNGYNKPPCSPVKECRCISGFVRHEGKCIRRSECPSKCTGENEIYIYTRYEDRTCDGPGNKTCTPGFACRCKPGYVRQNGVCIRECDCPSKCPQYEEYVLALYTEETCDGGVQLSCTPVRECRCIDGYVRHQGKCIKRCDCPPKCSDPNEEYVFTKYGEATCDQPKPVLCTPVTECRCRSGFVRHEGKCIRICDCLPKCSDPFEEYIFTKYEDETCDGKKPAGCVAVNACRCISGYVRHEGKCIKRCECPPKCKDPNEIFVLTKYEDATCDNDSAATCEEVEACRCRRGYVRHQGKCIKKCDCPPKCSDPNEVWVTTTYEDETCDGPGASCTKVTACRCRRGYVRYQGKCIKRCDCPPKCSDPNEIWITTTYEDETCDGGPAATCTEVTACRCREGYVRHEGKCITRCSCPPKCSDPFEEYITTTVGEATCDLPSPDPCKEVTECRCIFGYVRHEGKCIKLCDCPPKCKDPNEVFVRTIYEDATCDNDSAATCKEVEACRCRRGYVRHQGKCIKPCDCPKKCTDPFEEYVIAYIGEETCDGRGPAPCVIAPACRCIAGYVRHEGKCIKKCDCPPKCKDPNEVFIYATFGEATCDGRDPAPCKPVQECRCRNGYVRNNGKCIKPCDCPPKCPGPNEEYVWTQFPDRTCKQLNPPACGFKRECRCIDGYVRNEGKCIKMTECPCGPNEVFSECAPSIQATCTSNVVSKDCKPGCMCLPGFVRDCKNKCIRRCDC